MVLSISGIGGLGFSMVRPMNYSVENKADFSEAYTKSISQTAETSLGRVDAASPVGYANAQSVRVDNTAKLAKTQQVDRDYNDIAANFAGIQTGYSVGSASTGYVMLGSNFDMYA